MFNNLKIRVPIIISLGAIAGVLSRYYIGLWLLQNFETKFPIDIFLINISGCFLMGFLSTILARKYPLRPELVLLLITGFLGTYTTFSTYELNTAVNLNNLSRDLLYWIGSPILGLFCLEIGIKLAQITLSIKSRS